MSFGICVPRKFVHSNEDFEYHIKNEQDVEKVAVFLDRLKKLG